MSVSDLGYGSFNVTSVFGGSPQTLTFQADPDTCYLTGVNDLSPVSFDTPVLFMDDVLLQKGGTVRTATTVDNGLAALVVTVTVANAGTVTVPAGRFTNCRSITTSVKKTGSSSGVEVFTSSSSVSVFAPGVGMIETEVLPGIWAQLVNATVGGVFIGNGALAPLTLAFSGPGEVSVKGVTGLASAGGGAGLLLEVGQTYTATASPEDGSVFAGWADAATNVLTTSPTLTFVMERNLVLQPEFIPNPFAAAAGVYNGLFMPYTDSPTVQNCGSLFLAVTPKGAFSGYLLAGSTKYPLQGRLDAGGGGGASFPLRGGGTLSVSFTVDLQGGAVVTGTVGDGGWTSYLAGQQLISQPVVESGYGLYDVSLTDANGDPEAAAVLNFAKSGAGTLVARLPDGTRINASSMLSPLPDDLGWPFYQSLYGGQGCFIGWLYLGPGSVGGDFIWISPSSGVSQVSASGQPAF